MCGFIGKNLDRLIENYKEGRLPPSIAYMIKRNGLLDDLKALGKFSQGEEDEVHRKIAEYCSSQSHKDRLNLCGKIYIECPECHYKYPT